MIPNAVSNEDSGFDFLHMQLVSMLALNSKDEISMKEKTDDDPGVFLTVPKLEHMGYTVGYRIAERLNRDFPRFKDELDVMKFICKEFWSSIFSKQIDVLRTNHQCVYVLHDNRFRFLRKVTCTTQFMEDAPKFVTMTCGLLRGALSNFGINAIVTPEIFPESTLP